ncbi:MAG: DUF4832 domain-containing protein [Chloroflexota bacterium]
MKNSGITSLNKFIGLSSIILIGFIVIQLGIAESAFSSQTTSTVTYSELSSHFANPERGFYHYAETRASNPTAYNLTTLTNYRENENITLIYCINYLDSFMNQPISASFLAHIESNLNTVREAGLKCILRFAYTDDWNNETPPYGDATKSQILDHIDQLEPILTNNADIIALMQAGFIGVWGEWYYTQHFVDDPTTPWIVSATQWQNRLDVLEAEMEALPEDRFVAVRYVHAKTEMFSTTTPLNGSTAYDGSSFARTTFHNDCFLASSTDFGTYLDSTARQFMVDDTEYGAMGGETCNPNPPRTDCPTAVAELEEFHFSYLNIEYHPTVLAGWQSNNCFDQIERELGYRLVLTSGTFGDSVAPGDEFSFELNLTNRGYAAPFNQRPVQILLRNSNDASDIYQVTLPDDLRFWKTDLSQTLTYDFCIPSTMSAGTYDLLLNMPDGYISLQDQPEYSILVANSGGVQEFTTGYNDLQHQIVVSPSASSSNCSSTYQFKPLGVSELIYISSNTIGIVDNITFLDEDIMVYNAGTETWGYHFDGSDVGLKGNAFLDVDAFTLLDDESILLSIAGDSTLPNIGPVDDSDIVRFVPTQLGANTQGTFEMYFDGSDVGLTSNKEDIDGIAVLSDGRILISTLGAAQVLKQFGNTLNVLDEDIMAFTPISLGSNTSGFFSLYLDGSDLGLDTPEEDTWGVSINHDETNLFLTTQGNFNTGSIAGIAADIFTCIGLTTGNVSGCNTQSKFFDGALNGIGSEKLDGIDVRFD